MLKSFVCLLMAFSFAIDSNAQTLATASEKANARYISSSVLSASVERREENDNKSSGSLEGQGGTVYSIDGPLKADRISEQGYTVVPRAPQGFWWYLSCGTVLEYYDDMLVVKFTNAACNSAVIKLFNTNDVLQASITVAISGDFYPLSAGQILTGSQTVRAAEIPGSLFAKPAEGGNCNAGYLYQWQYSYNDTLYSNLDSCTTGDSLAIEGTIAKTTWFRRRVICGTDTLYTGSVAVFLLPEFSGGRITTPNQFISLNTVPPQIMATPAQNGECNNEYTYKWQSSGDGYLYDDIAGATGQNLSYNTPVTRTTWFRRKAYCDSLSAVTFPVIMKIATPPPVIPVTPKNIIDTLLLQAGVNIQNVFGIISDSIANNRPVANPALDSLDIIYRQKLELSPYGSPFTGIDQQDLAELAADSIMDNIQQRLMNDSLGISDTTVKPVFIPLIDDNIIQQYLADSNYHALDSMVHTAPQTPFEDVALLIDQAINANIPVAQRSYVPSVLPAGMRPGAVINGPPVAAPNQTLMYTAAFYYPPGNGSIQWIVSGGTIVSQNTNPISGGVYANVVWTNSPAAHYIAVYDNVTKQFDLLNIYPASLVMKGRIYPPVQSLYYNQTPCQLMATFTCNTNPAYTYQYQWQKMDIYASNPVWTDVTGSGGTATISGNSLIASLYQPAALQRPWLMYQCRVQAYSGSTLITTCYSSSASIQLEKPDGGTISAAVTDFAFNTVPVVTQTASNGGYTAPGYNYYYEWEYSVNGGPWTYFGYGQNYPSYAIRYTNTRIRRKVTISVAMTVGLWVPDEYRVAYSNEINFTTHYQTADFENRNYIRENVALVRGIDHWEDADGLPMDKKMQTTTYLDGIGRTVQTVGKGTHYDEAANQWYDMVQSITYEAGGRVDKAKLPYPTTDNPGKFKTNVATAQPAYYQSKFGDNNAYAKMEFDGSPLDRPRKSFAPGDSWAGSNVNVSGNVEVYNAATDQVKKWTIGYGQGEIPVASASAYAYGTIIKSWTTDEKGKNVVTYTDRNGNTILSKVQLADEATLTTHHDGWLCTYYVYDDFNQLRFTITPKAVKEAKANNWIITQEVADGLCYWYDYDEIGRQVVKKTPGKGAEYIVYDNRNRPMFTQDANARAKNEWMAVFYDELNRPVMTGILKGIFSHAQMLLNAKYAAGGNITTLTTTYGGIFKVNYTWLTSATINDPAQFVQLSFNYYDEYGFAGKKDIVPTEFDKLSFRNISYNGNIDDWYNTTRLFGMPTGSKVKVLNNATSPQFLSSTIYYDEEGRVVQGLADNIKGGTDMSSTQYHFDGRILSTVQTHNNPGTIYTNYSIVTKYRFDKIGRVTAIGKKLGANIQLNWADLVTNTNMTDIREEKDQVYKITAAYKYNEMGRTVRKTFAPNYNSGAGLETIDYSFNIRGWLTGINKDYALAETGNQWEHYFGMYIGYDNRDGKFAASQLNGQATGVQWKSQGDNTARKYDYVYDNANRLLAADFKEYNSGSWNTTKKDFSSKEISYDENGNLLSLTQMGILPGAAAPVIIDKLNYQYNPRSNRLYTVTDVGANPGNGKQGDFKDGTNTSTADYSYDDNGNILLDNNKKISTIVYNYLDKPELITISGETGSGGGTVGGGTIKYVYDAGGSKMQKVVTENPTPGNGNQTVITTTTYIGAFVYAESNIASATAGLQMIMHEEGRIRIITPYENAADPANVMSGGISMPGGKQGVFDYFIKDNLANLRATITEEINKASGVCTMEDANATIKQNEEATFGNPGGNNEVNSTRTPRPDIWTSATVPPLTLAQNQKVSKLQALGGVPKTGPNAFLKVMVGDKLRAKVDYYYVTDPGNTGGGSNGLNALLTSLGTALAGGRAAPVTHGQEAAITGALNNSIPLQSLYNAQPGTGNPNAPRAYLNWIFLDEQFNYVSECSGFMRVQQSGNGAPALIMNETKAIRNGYVYIYLSNESGEPVYFDNFTVSHDRSQLIAEDHYYAYGLRIASISSRSVSSSLNAALPKYGYQGSYSGETLEFSLNYNEFFLRTYDPQIGRWTTSDPFDQFASPYGGMGMDPANNTDPTGGIVPMPGPGPIVKTLENVTIYATKAASVTNTVSSTLTTLSTTLSTIAMAGNLLLNSCQNPGGGSSTRDNPSVIGTSAHFTLSAYLQGQNLLSFRSQVRWITGEILPNSKLKPDIIDDINKNVWELKPSTWDPSTPGNKSYPNYLKAKVQINNYVTKMNSGDTNLTGQFSVGGAFNETPVPLGPLPRLTLPSLDGLYEFTYYINNPASGIVYYQYSMKNSKPDDKRPPVAIAKPDSKQDQKPNTGGKVISMPQIDTEKATKVGWAAVIGTIIWWGFKILAAPETGGASLLIPL